MKLVPILLLAGTSALLALESPKQHAREAAKPVTPAPAMVVPADDRPFVNKPDGGGLVVTGQEDVLKDYSSVSITFPTEVVTADKVDAQNVESPLAIWPDLNCTFTWTSPTEGGATLNGPLIPDQTYRFRLRSGSKDLAGKDLPVDKWGFEMKTDALRVTEENYGTRDHLNAQPQVPLEFNYPIRLTDAAQGIWFQDRSSRARYPVEVLLNRASGDLQADETVDIKDAPADDVTSFRVRPLNPLPSGRTFDLVVDGVRDAFAGRPLAYPQVYALGTTTPLEVDYVASRNYPLEKTMVEVKFAQPLGDEPLPPGALAFQPPVPNLQIRKDGASVVAEGDFDTTKRYDVTVTPKILGATGYGLAKAEVWHTSFRPKVSTILFPNTQVRERSVLGLSFAFYQVNTSDLKWSIAPIPREKLPEILDREKEFVAPLTDNDDNPIFNKDGIFEYPTSESLIKAFGLTSIGEGTFPADQSSQEVLREIHWKANQASQLEGPMLLEVMGLDAKGQEIGNRAVIYFGEAALTRKVTLADTIVRLAGLSDGRPLAQAKVTVLDRNLAPLTSAQTDAQGLASWPGAATGNGVYFLAEAPGISTLQPIALCDEFPDGTLSATQPPALRAYTFCDRPLYRPGQDIRFKGFVRQQEGDALKIPAGQPVTWSIEKQYTTDVIASGQTKVDAQGGWSGGWTPPEGADVGDFDVKIQIGKTEDVGTRATFKIEEFRNPAFSVICSEAEDSKPAEAQIKVASQYFHGAPNVGSKVKWTVTWLSDVSDGYYSGKEGDDMTRVDLYSDGVASPTYVGEATGETSLDANGMATLTSVAPYKDPGNRAWCYVSWKVDVTGPDGQTITGGCSSTVAMAPVLFGVKHDDSDPKKVQFRWDAKEISGKTPAGTEAQLYLVETKSVKERLAPDVYRYRNFDQYSLIEKRPLPKEDLLSFSPTKPGRYVLLIVPPKGSGSFPVSEEAYLSGEAESEVPVVTDTTAKVASTRPDTEPWKVGETAIFNVTAPAGGIAWVTVETNHILDTFTVPLEGNTSRIEIPVKPEYEPNAYVCVYILHPGGDNSLAGEMFGSTSLIVTAPDRELTITPAMDQPSYEPRQKVTGSVTVTADGDPLPNVDLTLYAVDDSILTLGQWTLPSLITSSFFPARPWAVQTYGALKAYVDKIAPSWLTSKGFVVGDGGGDEYANAAFTRKDFKPIIMWLPNARTDAQGKVTFMCEAPDNLTRFRVIAVGQTKANQFGAGDTTFEVSKKLMIEPALPRFVREGDEVELRAVVRQKVEPEQKLIVHCAVTGGIELLDTAPQEVTAQKDAPVVVRFKARATATGGAQVKFDVGSTSNLADAVEISLPVESPVILKREAVSGRIDNSKLQVASVAPSDWAHGQGTFSLAASSTPWLPQLMGLPYLLEYPHGCFEQKSSRLLGYTYLAGLLEYLPDADAQKKNYETVIEKTLTEFEAGLLADGRLPYWPNGVTANDYVTIQAAWCVNQAEQAGFKIPERLASELPDALDRIARNTGGLNVLPTLRAFALYVVAWSDTEASPEILAAANELYLQRDKLTAEGLATLALAFNGLKAEPDKQAELVKELPYDYSKLGFDPRTFSSATRTEALCVLARLAVHPDDNTDVFRQRIDKLLDQSSNLSTQENLWLLVAFDAILGESKAPRIGGVKPKPQEVSGNGAGVKWTAQDLAKLAAFDVTGLPTPKLGGSYVLSAAYRTDELETPLVSHGMKVERVVKNLTEATRDGSATAPFRLGDQLLISYRFSNEKTQDYVALEDLLPAGIEVVNPNLALFGTTYAVPDAGDTADLSHSEMRDRSTMLYFDNLPEGHHSYAVLARATAAGKFIWPSTQISPMYDSRVFGRSPSSTCAISAE